MAKTIVFITGGNNGLGYYATQQLATTGKYHVLMGSRDLKKAEAAIKSLGEDTSLPVDVKDVEPVEIDVTSDASIHAAATTVSERHGHIDILMLNAGIAQQQTPASDGTGPTLREIYHNHFDTNLFGAVVTLEAFLPLLRKSTVPGGKRVAFTSSGLGTFAMASGEGGYRSSLIEYPIYASTKTANSIVMLAYAGMLEKEGFVVSASNPGYCATNLNHHKGLKDPREGAKALVRAAVGKREDVHALMVNETGVTPW